MTISRRNLMVAGGSAAAIALLTGCTERAKSTGGSAGGEFPSQGLTIIAAGSAGGGLDTASRTLQAGLKAVDIGQRVTIENIGGGGGNPARAALLKRPADGYTVVAESSRIYLAPLMGTTDMTVDDFTPLANLTSDFEVWVVSADSEFESAQQILDEIVKDPKAVSFGVGTTPSDDQFNILLPAMKAGVEDITALNVVAFKEGGDLNTELLGGHVQVASTGLSEAVTLAKSGKFRILAVSSKERIDSVKDVPTWTELGYDVVIPHWRGIFGPADMPEDAKKWWIDAIKKASESDEFITKTENVDLTVDFAGGEDFMKDIIEPGKKNAEDIIGKLGLGK